MTSPTVPRSGKRHPGPPLLGAAVLFAVPFLAAILAGPILGAGTVPSPFDGDAGAYFASSRQATQVGGFLLLYAALGLAFFSAVAMSRLTFLAPNAPGPTFAGVGGLCAAGLLAISGVAQWSLSRPEVVDDRATAHALQYVAFASGGPAHTLGLGFLVFGLTVTAWFLDRTPRRLTQAGAVIAVVCGLSGVVLLAPELAPLMALGRFAAIAWVVAVAALLPRDRGTRGDRRPGRPTRSPVVTATRTGTTGAEVGA